MTDEDSEWTPLEDTNGPDIEWVDPDAKVLANLQAELANRDEIIQKLIASVRELTAGFDAMAQAIARARTALGDLTESLNEENPINEEESTT